MFYEPQPVIGKISYRLNGADRFQLFFDSVARKNTGVGNVIRAVVTLEGRLSEADFRQNIFSNKTIRFLLGLSLEKNRFSTFFYFEQKRFSNELENALTFYSGEKAEDAMAHALARDCSFFSGFPIHIDVIYDKNRTHIVFSVTHVSMDYMGMENLLMSVFWNKYVETMASMEEQQKSFFEKFRETVEATFFIAARTAWNMRRLSVKTGGSKPAFEKLELTSEETIKLKQMFIGEIRTNSLSFYLGCSLFSLNQNQKLLAGKNGNYFIAVPLERRPMEYKNVVLSNFHSYLYFYAKADDIKSVRDISHSFSQQMIMQARRRMPEKFTALLDLFRFIPGPVYRAFINLPTNGHSGTFALSLLPNSGLEKKSFGDCHVIDVTHYAPVIAPPGLNIVFNEFDGRLKIILSFDEGRMTKIQAKELLQNIRKNLLA